ncbi:MAG: hypothetical protein MSC31_14215 [Solirubrobacteraceae bacterium MAG38_C4-C5]|nr:hypothetical protein [Candidatus Siliceabacter maunaloa]
MSDGAWYPKRETFFAALSDDRPIFQGDIFRGVPTVFVAHPAAREAAFAEASPPSPREAERPLTAEDVREGIAVRGPRAMIMPHPCDFSEEEKGASHSVRLVARVLRVSDTPFAPKQVARGQVHHVMWVPDPEHNEAGPHDWAVDLRTATPVDRAFLNVDRRIAALSGPAWMALMRRLVYFYTRMSIPLQQLALQEAHQHPDYEHLADEFYAGEQASG